MGMRTSDAAAFADGEAPAMPWIERLRRKALGIGIRFFFAWKRWSCRWRFPWRGKLRHIDHITVPCDDLAVAEEFYVGFLGAKPVLRIDRALLLRMGWSAEAIERNRAPNLSVTFGAGPRLELFDYPDGRQPEAAMHPHIAFMVAANDFLTWKRRLEGRGVIVAGPTQAGPAGQASFYFNDPFGNHLEIVTVGFTAAKLPIGVPDRSRLNYRWKRS
ncbi:MAG TPA: VOC family protein [Stellaceae bacterium]|jgi:catechol 2,3-dioxygenase-like lactoylglutathione lyase family enzyme|nr:VOC family protein [Stellaceae bacterium]